MIGVMDIKHLLCHPASVSIKTEFACQDPSLSSLASNSSSPTSPYVLPLPTHLEHAEFWKHNRSVSTASSASSCTTNSSASSSSSIHMSTEKYRRRVNSESDTRFLVQLCPVQQQQFQHQQPQQQKSKPSKRARCNSASYIQTRIPWTPEEDDLLQKGYEQGLSWAMISCTFLPHRSRGCCWGRFKTLQSKNAIEVYQQRICQRPWKAHLKK
ncbi:hypothetical protein [Parasitella parasitica]|uniref:Myb-like domain-containing protein n=1 Tax=Parasitella parasitica TaxID=35722 RepID=A0A0B7N4C3_9FUNG|nr:hypothetical protein [Parasitella parasitica]